MLYNETPRSAWTVSEANHTVRSYTLKTSLLYTRCLCAVNVACLKSQVGLLQTVHSWANAGVLLGARMGRRVAFETIKLFDAKVLSTIFDINYHPNIAHRPYKHARGICISRYVGPYAYGELKCDRLHILICLL